MSTTKDIDGIVKDLASAEARLAERIGKAVEALALAARQGKALRYDLEAVAAEVWAAEAELRVIVPALRYLERARDNGSEIDWAAEVRSAARRDLQRLLMDLSGSASTSHAHNARVALEAKGTRAGIAMLAGAVGDRDLRELAR
jgi:hypothetical protein